MKSKNPRIRGLINEKFKWIFETIPYQPLSKLNLMTHPIKFAWSGLLALVLCTSTIQAAVISTVNYKSKTYHVDVISKAKSGEVSAEIWFRVAKTGTSNQDILIAQLTGTTKKLKEYANLACRQKEIFENGKLILGCTSVIGSSFCAVGAVATDGALAFVCASTWKYATEKGAADCVEGVADAVASYLKKQNEWKVIATGANLQDLKFGEAISKSIDYMCEDLKKN